MNSPVNVQRMLVLDDDEVIRDLLFALLSLQGIEVHVAASGEEALQRLQEDRSFQLVLSDVHMPGLEGEALTVRLRAALPAEALLVGMSGSVPPESTRALFDAFVAKPFDWNDLKAALRSARAHSRHQGEAEATDPQSVVDGLPVLDEAIFTSLLQMIPGPKLEELYGMTLDDITKRHARIETAGKAGDLAAVQREAHAIKGTCGMVGATELQALAAAIEDGTSLNTSALEEIPAACLRLRRMLNAKLHIV